MASICDPFNKIIIAMASSGYRDREIAAHTGLSASVIANYRRRILKIKSTYLKERTKHKHLHEKLLKYFLNHTFEQCMEKFKLTKKEAKSCFTYAYRNPSFSHIRKDLRKKDAWTMKEIKYLLMYSGIKSRDEINKRLKRGLTSRVIKEKLGKLGVGSKNLNGLTLSQYRALFKKDPEKTIKTSAGSGARKAQSHVRLITWEQLNQEIKSKKLKHSKEITLYIESMAMFQAWVKNA